MAQQREIRLVSEDGGLTWTLTERPWPGPSRNRVTFPDGVALETSSPWWERHPRSEMDQLKRQGYDVWDLGADHGYCAIVYAVWMRRSTDRGKTWIEKPIHTQFPFFAHFVLSALGGGTDPPQSLLEDGSVVTFAYGYAKPGERWSSYALRTADRGDTWQLSLMGDGRLAGDSRGFGEIYPVVRGDGRIFAMLRTEDQKPAFRVYSSDGGKTWTRPVQTPIIAKHPDLTLLGDGSILCTYARRQGQPLGVRGRFSADFGETWSEEVVIRDEIPFADGLYWPMTVERKDKSLFTLFTAKKYLDDGTPRSFLGGSGWTAGYRRPYAPSLPVPPAQPMYNIEARNKSPWQIERETSRSSGASNRSAGARDG